MAAGELEEGVAAAWRRNHGINVRLIRAIGKEGMRCTLSTRGGRNVVRQFAHVHNVRVYQLRKRGKAFSEGVRVFESKEEPDRRALLKAMDDSAGRVERWLLAAAAGEKGALTMPGGVVPTLGYLVSHESHHRGSIALTLKQCGHALDAATRGALWGDWGRASA